MDATNTNFSPTRAPQLMFVLSFLHILQGTHYLSCVHTPHALLTTTLSLFPPPYHSNQPRGFRITWPTAVVPYHAADWFDQKKIETTPPQCASATVSCETEAWYH
ncbi:hypothetical protein M406DRAFT_102403 [Cryphonectria parasitica EP155]|uniref:Secreted protein n=1 Tax=Cryphonectria parasitica (strain ATCC 38755 / EP155) TaxID=660469 RepID=A0A9P4Y2F0_CRYP1|nr:uncharacterized protein M406DRAFT_102403 [Cryphonectria parasitica EP155]KAF3764925.1 hypothetical protein M406DRAFT_102403 [Cryphonectria parasitica EP155]